VSLRAAPSVGAVRVTTVREGALLLATGEARQSEGRSWRKVRDAGGAEGWVVAEFVAPA
jgi:SH3-like domain-containing protein